MRHVSGVDHSNVAQPKEITNFNPPAIGTKIKKKKIAEFPPFASLPRFYFLSLSPFFKLPLQDSALNQQRLLLHFHTSKDLRQILTLHLAPRICSQCSLKFRFLMFFTLFSFLGHCFVARIWVTDGNWLSLPSVFRRSVRSLWIQPPRWETGISHLFHSLLVACLFTMTMSFGELDWDFILSFLSLF